MENKICSVCGKEENRYEMVKLEGEWYCTDCLEKMFFYCEEHRDYEPIEELIAFIDVYDNGLTMCRKAYEEKYYVCDDCGMPVRKNDTYNVSGDKHICPKCFEERKVIKHYHHSHGSERNFFGNPVNGIYFGLEIESEAREYEDLNSIASEVRNGIGKDKVHFEEDGSLDNGFETITEPMSYEFMKNNRIVEGITSLLDCNGMYASERCGLHIHITRTEEVDRKIPKILSFLESNKEDIIIFSRRDEDSFHEWCEFYTDEHTLTAYEAERICLRPQGRRHMCINLTNSNTIEFRCFAGTLNAKTIYGCIEFILALLENIEDMYANKETPTFEDLIKVNGFDLFKECLRF